MAKIIRYDNKCQLLEEDDEKVIKALDFQLSYRIQGAEHSKAFKGYVNARGEEVTWDGRKHLMESNLRFPVGLLDKVIDFYEERGLDLEIVDQRRNTSETSPIDIMPRLNEMGIKPRDYQINAAEKAANVNRGIIRIATGGGKCVSKDSLMITSEGMLDYSELMDGINLKKEEACNYDIDVATILGNNGKDKSSMIYYDGFSDSIKIQTSFRYTITGTPNHKIQILNNNGNVVWKKVSQLEVGDYALVCPGTNMFGQEDMDNDEAYWYGMLMGDGSLTLKNRVELINQDPHILKFAEKYTAKLGLKLSERVDGNTKAKRLRIFKKEYREKLFNIGFDYKKATEKIIPKQIRRLKKEPLAMFIRGMFETDGWVDTTRNIIGIGLANERLINQIQLILLNFGVVSCVHEKTDNRKESYNNYYVLNIYGKYIDIFNESIGFDPNGYKYKKAVNIKYSDISKKQNIPHQCLRLKNIMIAGVKKYGTNKSFLNDCPVNYSSVKRWINGSVTPPAKRLEDFLRWAQEKIECEDDIEECLKLCSSKMFFDKITNVKKTKSHNYDFVIPETHSFVSQGFLNHNTVVSALITANLGKSTLILVIGKDLLYQIHSFYEKVFDEPIGIIGDGKCEIHRINVATVWTIGNVLGFKDLPEDSAKEKEVSKDNTRKIKEMLLSSKNIIMDECHLAACETVQSINHHVKAEHFYGMSASPWRDDGANLLIEAILGRRIVDISAKYLISKGFLVNPVIRFLAVPGYSGSKSAHYKTVYKNYVTTNKVRNEMICTAATKLVEQGFKTLVLFKNKAHGKRLYEMISENVNCAILDGDDKFSVREEVCSQLNSGEIDCIIASTIFDIGVDLPSLSALVIGGGGKSSVRALQRVGRVIRKFEGKTIAPVIDFADQAPYLLDHSLTRRDILEEEFEVQWPEEKPKQ